MDFDREIGTTIWPVLITGISAAPVRTIRLLVSGRRDDSYERSMDSKKAANFFDRTCQWNQRPSRSGPFKLALPLLLADREEVVNPCIGVEWICDLLVKICL